MALFSRVDFLFWVFVCQDNMDQGKEKRREGEARFSGSKGRSVGDSGMHTDTKPGSSKKKIVKPRLREAPALEGAERGVETE